MIDRYSRPEMKAVWSEENKYRKWLDVELAVCQAWAELGQIPKAALKTIEEKAAFDTARIEEVELTVKHDVIAFLTCLAEHVGVESRYIHLGLTSYDVVDTALSLLIKESLPRSRAKPPRSATSSASRPSATRGRSWSAGRTACMPSPSPSESSSWSGMRR